jgi:crossover junction endodeoxyribonuclease RusA
MPPISITAYGTPIPQGSKRIGRNRRTGKPNLIDDNAETRPWRQHVTTCAQLTTRLPVPIDAPVRVQLTFTMPKPATAPKRRRSWPATKPDVDKLTRAIFDSLQDAGIIREDSRVVHVSAEKVYPDEPGIHCEALPRPGVQITLWRIGAEATGGLGLLAVAA